jgi:multimeric flavodoxin WrbA
MHILTLQGSPRRRGNTAAVLRCFEQQAASSPHAPERLEHLELSDYKVNGCLGCGTCQKVFDQPGCRQQDDALAVFARLGAADLIVYATPLYCWDFSSQLKALMDRHYCLIKWDAPGGRRSLLAGKRAALLVTCGDEIENNADVVQVIFRRELEVADMTLAGIYIVPNCSTPAKLGARAAEMAEHMANELL